MRLSFAKIAFSVTCENAIISIIKKLLRQSKSQTQAIDQQYLIPRSAHNVSKTDINPNALQVLNVLSKAGYSAYLVGGSVRDLLLHKAPKDFDVATDAKPNQIKKLFKNSRIIGRRFKLVHVVFQRDIVEVATFRGNNTSHAHHQQNERGMLIKDNVYGTLKEDAWRRDFTVNSLYYDINSGAIVDYTGGIKDINTRLINMIGDAEQRYQEDPVRMLRAIRFAAKLNFSIEKNASEQILHNNHLLSHVANSRLFDEMVKLYQCGEAQTSQQLLEQQQLFPILFPQTAKLLDSSYPVQKLLNLALTNTDARIKENKPVTPAFIFAILLWFPLLELIETYKEEGMEPLNAIEKAMAQVISTQSRIISIPKRFTQVMREIWMLQYRFPKRAGKRADNLLRHARFRAAYDFLALRALANDAPIELAKWWETYQEADPKLRSSMVSKIKHPQKKKR